jgi:NAD(P)-dependent dehydrogenase (short-subunit alcohol dehydrogenase family)
MARYRGRHALVTGAANGIGRAIAERLAADGARVSGLDIERGETAGVERWWRVDLGDTEALPDVCRRVTEESGPVDVLVSVAGVYEPAPATDVELASYRRVLAVNLDAPVFLASRLGHGMAERGYGRILHITSIHGQVGEELGLSYDVSKAGLNGATRTLAIELGPRGVLVNALAPGFVRTRMSVVDGRDELESEWFRTIYVENRKLPLRRAAEPHEVAAHAAWLCSEENTYLTGQVVTVDGGVTVTF